MAKKQEKTIKNKAANTNGQRITIQGIALKPLLDALPQNIYQKDLDGRFLFCNQAFLSSINMTAEDVYGKTVYDFYPKEQADKFTKEDEHLLNQGQEINLIEEIADEKTGKFKYIHIVKTATRSPEGDIVGTQGIWWDVTKRVNAEIDLQTKESRLKTILDSLTMPIVISRVNDGQIVYANEDLSNLLRTPLENLVGKQTPDFYHDTNDRKRVIDMIQTRGEVKNFDLHLKKSDGELFWGLLSAKLFEFENEPAIITTIADITDKKQVTQAFESALESTETQAHRLSLLNELGVGLNGASVVSQVYTTTAEHIFQILPCDQASVAVLNSSGDKFDVVMLQAILENPTQMDVEGTAMARAMEEQQIFRLPNDAPIADYIDGRIRLEAGLHSFICVPLVAQGESIGVLTVASEQEDGFQDNDLGFVQQIASMLANALQSRRNDEQARLLATIVENHPDLIGISSLFGQAIYLNPAGRQMIGLSAEDDIAQFMATDFYNDEDADFLLNEIIPNALEGGSWSGESNLRRTDEKLVPVEQVININYDIENNPTSFAITMHDITERHESQAELARQAAEMSTVAEISTIIAGTLDPEQLLIDVANITKEKFDLYHAHIYLLNDTQEALLLKAGSGEIGKMMVAEKRAIPLSQKYSLVARAARERKGVIVNNVYIDSTFLPHPALPNTRSELAVPLLAGDQLLGVLDIQADTFDRFTNEDLIVESTLASQIAIALVNARTYAGSEKAREQLNELTRRLTREGWEDYMERLTTNLAYSYDLDKVSVDKNEAVANAENLIQPLNIQGETIGQLALAIPEDTMDDASEIVSAIAGSLSAHLENLRLTEQTQVALSETESLYNTSVQLNASTTLDQILASAFELPSRAGASSGELYTFGLADNGLPEWADLVATIGDSPENVGARKYAPEFVLANLWLNDPKGAVLISNIANDPVISKDEKERFKKEKTVAVAILPLTVGTRKIGQINFRWHKAREFSNADQRIFNAIATQAASIVYSRLLFRQTDEALSETAALYQGSADLNTANTYQDVLKALRHHTLLGQNSSTISINYFNHSWVGDDMPEWADILAIWSKKEIDEDRLTSRFEIAEYPSAKILLSPTKPTIIEDVAKDERLDKKLRALFQKQFGAKTVVVIPLVIGGHWAGYLFATYAQKTTFPDQEIRRTIALSRQAAVAIENVRLFVQTETQLANLTTIQETTSQLTASRSFNEAVHALLPQLNKAASSEVASMHIVKEEMMTLIATYPLSEQKNVMVPVPLTDSPMINRVVADRKPLSLTADDPTLDAHEREQLQTEGVFAVVTVPLLTSAGILGVLSVKSTQPNRFFAEQEISLLQTLAAQATIAFERMRLLDETSRRAQHEQTLREIAAKVRGSADVDVVLRTAVEEVGKVLGRQAYVYLQDSEKA